MKKNPFNKAKINSFMSIGQVGSYLKIAADLKINLALCGAHGRAKTSVIKQYADENGYELITIILSRLTPEDMIGLPTTKNVGDNTVTTFSNPDWLVAASDKNKKVLLFFDEFTNAEVDTQASILDLIESREANGLKLCETTQIVMAYNPSSIAPNGRRLSKATRDRICVIPILDEHSKVSYSDYYRKNGMGAIANILNDTEDLIISYDDDVTSEAYDNAEFTYRSLEKSFKIVKYCIDNNISCAEGIASVMVCGYGGEYGKAIAKRLFDEINNESNSGAIRDRYAGAYGDGGIDSVIEMFSKEDFNDYHEIKGVVDVIKEIVHPIDLQKLLSTCTTNEFRVVYNSGSMK